MYLFINIHNGLSRFFIIAIVLPIACKSGTVGLMVNLIFEYESLFISPASAGLIKSRSSNYSFRVVSIVE